jgi:hypothetical protein
MKKYLNYLWKGLAIFGGLVAVAMIFRSQQTAKNSGGSVKLTDAMAGEAKKVTSFNNLVVVLIGVVSGMVALWSAGHDSVLGVTQAFLWGSIAASVAGSFNITYVPQFIGFTVTSAPTSFVINVQGDGVTFNLDATGITNMTNIRYIGILSNQYVFQIADGLINGKNGTVTITNAAAAQLDIYAWSKQPGSFYYTYLTQNALLNSGIVLRDFAYVALPSAAATDSFTIEYNTGITQISTRPDIGYALGYKQNVAAARYAIDNIAPATVKSLTFIPAASQNVYAMTYQSQKGTVSAALIAK